MQNDKRKESDKDAAGSYGLTDSPCVVRVELSSSLKEGFRSPISRPILSPSLKERLRYRLTRFRSPISRLSSTSLAAKSTQPKLPAQEHSKEDIEKAMNEPEINESTSSSSEKIGIDESASSSSTEESKESVGSSSNQDAAICITLSSDSEENDGSFLKDDYENDVAKSGSKLNKNVRPISLKSFDNGKDKSDSEMIANASCSSKEYICSHSAKDIENCVDKESVLEIFHNLQKDYAENKEKERKLRLVQKHHNKNCPVAINSLDPKWLTCMQLTLKKLYSFMAGTEMTFAIFLKFLQVDFDTVKYNPKTNTFS